MEMWNGFRSYLGLEGLTAVGERKGRRKGRAFGVENYLVIG